LGWEVPLGKTQRGGKVDLFSERSRKAMWNNKNITDKEGDDLKKGRKEPDWEGRFAYLKRKGEGEKKYQRVGASPVKGKGGKRKGG